MGDLELKHLLSNGVLPDTQPYQTIVEGEAGRRYAEKYLRGAKKPSPSRPLGSTPTTVVEFVVPRELVEQLFAMQSKIEDGVLSHGLGDKGGGGDGISTIREVIGRTEKGDATGNAIQVLTCVVVAVARVRVAACASV